LIDFSRLTIPGADLRGASLLAAATVASVALTSPVRATTLMPTGDSITQGIGSDTDLGFRPPLFTALNAIGSFDFVGSDACAFGDPPYEGFYFAGRPIGDFLPGGLHDLADIVPDAEPEVIAIHLGTNDVNSTPGPYGPWSANHSVPSGNATGRLGGVIRHALSFSSVDRVVVSRIIPIIGRDDDIATFNREVVRIVLDFRNGAVTGSPEPVHLADHYLRFTSNPNFLLDWMDDDLHPNDSGYGQMSTVYAAAVNAAMNDAMAPDPPTDLAIGTVNGDSILLLWTNTGDDAAIGNPSYPDCRFATSPITSANFRSQNHGGDYALVGAGGAVGSTSVTGLSPATAYHFAMKLMDDAANLSGMSNTVLVTTADDDDSFIDHFNRPFPNPGPHWATADFEVEQNLLRNQADGFATCIFTAVQNPAICQFAWAADADLTGIEQAGFACRLEGTNPATVDGYLAYRNTGPAEGLSLRELVNGQPGPLIDTSPAGLPPPQAGDEMRVLMSSDAAGHHFAIYVNGQLDGTLSDPLRRYGNGNFYTGFTSDGTLNNDIDDWMAQAITINQPPTAFDLESPADGQTLSNLNPVFDWQTATDPNGDLIRYEVHLSTSPDFHPNETTVTGGIVRSDFSTGVPLVANRTYHWKVRAVDLQGDGIFSNQTWSFSTGDFHQRVDDFDRQALGPNWAADPSYGLVSGELNGTATGFTDLAVYSSVDNPVSVEWQWSEDATETGIGVGGALIGMDSASPNASGYFVFRNTHGSQRWSVFEVVNGELTGSLGIDRSGFNSIPEAGDRVRVVLAKTPTAHHFDCYINDVYDARMTDTQRLQGGGPTTYAGLLLGEDDENNVEEFVVMAEGLNLPPAAFNLLQPADNSIVFSFTPAVQWQPASDPNPGDLVLYRVLYDEDPAFGSPETVGPTAETSLFLYGDLVPGNLYYWKVVAEDGGGAMVTSNQTWRFVTSAVTTLIDDFNRAELGSDWGGDTNVMAIVGDELRNTSPIGSFDMAIYAGRTNPDAVEFRWSPNADRDGIVRGGMALRMNFATGTASGYWLNIDPFLNRSELEEIRVGGNGVTLDLADGVVDPPEAGDTWRVVLSSDQDGHYFDVYVNGIFHSRLVDPAKLQGNGASWFAGVGLRGQVANQVDDFTLYFVGGAPPASFALVSPPPNALAVPVQPAFEWRAAGPEGLLYLVYLNTSATFSGADSALALTDTTLTWPQALAANTDYFWQVRGTDGQNSRFSTGGWSRFQTTVSPVEIQSFAAIGSPGAVTLTWSTGREVNHRGFRVWRADEPEGKYTLLSGEEEIGGESPYRYVDTTAPPGVTLFYRLEALSRNGDPSQFFGPVGATALAPVLPLALHPNIPNPFNPSTALTFDLPARAEVRLLIFDSSGRAVRELVRGIREPGTHGVFWDGRRDDGQPAGSGVYFARLATGGETRTRKLILLR
jgi:GDSL-like Lipase/Acylhydrolase family/FlgD Ig-like domain